MGDILEIDASTVLVDGDDIDFGLSGTDTDVSQLVAIAVAETAPVPSQVSQLALVSIQTPEAIETNLSQFAMISVVANNINYLQLREPFSLPCFNPCNSYGTFATVIRIN